MLLEYLLNTIIIIINEKYAKNIYLFIKNIVTNKDCLLYEIIIPDMQIAPFKLKRQLINI